MAENWKTVGECDLKDSGMLILTDPSYVTPPSLWPSFLEKLKENEFREGADLGRDGVMVRPAPGFGVYPVEALYDEDGLIISVRVDFR